MDLNNQLNFNIYLFIVTTCLILISLFFPMQKVKAYRNISAMEINKMISNLTSNTLIIDVRNPEEYRKGYIPESINIPIQILKEQLLNKNVDKHTRIIVYCQNNFRSRNAAQMLDDLGFTDISCFSGINEYPYSLIKN